MVTHVPHSFLKEGKVVVFADDHHRPLDIPDRAVRRRKIAIERKEESIGNAQNVSDIA